MHTLPAVARLKAAWPESRLSWVINTEWAELLAGNADVDEIVPFPRRHFRGMWGVPKFVRWCGATIQGRKPDLALDFQGLLRSALIGRASRPGRFYGMADAREGGRLLYHRVAPTLAGTPHAVERYLALANFALDSLGISRPAQELKFSLPDGNPPDAAKENLPKDFVALHPFARGFGKSLTAVQIKAFCERLAPRPVVLIGKRNHPKVPIPTAATDLSERTSLTELIWVMRRAACVISVDSGPSHLAAALGTPMVAVHTWTDPRRVGPYRQDAWVWKSGRLQTMAQIATENESFFRQPPAPLSTADIDAICDRAISLSRSSA